MGWADVWHEISGWIKSDFNEKRRWNDCLYMGNSPKSPNFQAIFRLGNDDISARMNGTVRNRDTAENHLCHMDVDWICCVFDGFCYGFFIRGTVRRCLFDDYRIQGEPKEQYRKVKQINRLSFGTCFSALKCQVLFFWWHPGMYALLCLVCEPSRFQRWFMTPLCKICKWIESFFPSPLFSQKYSYGS